MKRCVLTAFAGALAFLPRSVQASGVMESRPAGDAPRATTSAQALEPLFAGASASTTASAGGPSAAAAGPTSPAEGPTSPAAEALVRSFYDAVNRGDQVALAALLAPDFAEDAALPGLRTGGPGLGAWVAAVRKAFPDARVDLLDVLAQGGKVAVRYRFSGTQRGRFFSLKATNKRASVLGMDLWSVKDGKLAAQSGCLDSMGMLVQLGIAPELR